MIFESPKDAMPWVGLYIAIASLICTLAMAADAIQAFWQRKLWFPNRFFTLNAATFTLIVVAMKLPVDLTNDMSQYEELATKMYCMTFLKTMLANFLPSLGLMDDRELLMNMVALGILMITIVVNIGIRFDASTIVPEVATFIFPTLWPFSVAITVSATRKKLEREYKELQPFVSCHAMKIKCFLSRNTNVMLKSAG
ncbi:hypothetical protein HanPI659440_Chr11g0440091 [Helianthus annuus]|nr:hypothetical protein HanPI659440_Chr11g0440091 [Helianthus annuus]